ncbi:phosphoesterase RecJ domain-containing protein [Candidatus Magnetomorum sp. HK-1]|nr:phosphoesterase RecJ domain-containing protein [Candidatus Magnetomorum sp. HK-1]
MSVSNVEKLRRLYELFQKDDHVLILINADPDAIASAMAIKRLLWHHVSGVTISHVNTIVRPDNLAMIRLLSAKLVPFEKINSEIYNRFVLVDSQPSHHPIFSQFHFDIIIDHHPDTHPEASFVDIQPEYGANSTILTEYLRAAKVRPSKNLATALFYAIKTDTGNFNRQGKSEDVRAFQYLFPLVNIHIIKKLEFAEMRMDFIKYYQIALDKMSLRGGKIYVYLGPVSTPDICVSIADFFTRIHSVTWSIISGFYNDELILIVRNDGMQKDAGKTIKKAFGKFGSAGGHKSMARAQIPVSNVEEIIDCKERKETQDWIIKRFEKHARKRPVEKNFFKEILST